MMPPLHNRLAAFMVNLECLSCTGQKDAFTNEVMETFGRFDPPRGDNTHLWELELHDITAVGTSEEETIANWKRLARKHCDLHESSADGFLHIPTQQHVEGAI